MALSQTSPNPLFMAERRVVQRYSVNRPATFRMAGGVRDGRLVDLSARGAQLEVPEPPAPGTSGLLGWLDQEQFCTVMWSKGQSCGVVFERPISLDLIEQSGEMIEIAAGPVAQFDNIPLGARGRRAALVSSEEEKNDEANGGTDLRPRGVSSLKARFSRLRLVR